MASHYSSWLLQNRSFSGFNPVTNITSSQLIQRQEEFYLMRRTLSQVTNQRACEPYADYSCLPPGIILGEHLFSSTAARRRLRDSNDVTSTIISPNISSLRDGDGGIKDEIENVVRECDGRTHSLPYQKYGPYTCPNCNREFPTSQHFAAHMNSHYKNETPAQRKRRHQARLSSKNKSLQLSQSQHGLTLLPHHSNPLPRMSNTQSTIQQKFNPHASSYSAVKIKDEPVHI